MGIFRLFISSGFITDTLLVALGCFTTASSSAYPGGLLISLALYFHRKHRRARDRSRSSSSSSQSSHSYKAEEYTEETEEREESTTGFDKSRLGTKDFVGPSERGGRARGTFVRPCPLPLSLSPYFHNSVFIRKLFCCPCYM